MTSDTTDTQQDRRARTAGRWSEIILTLLILAVVLTFLNATFGKTSAFAQASSGRGPFFFPRIVLALLLGMLPFLVVGLRHHPRSLPPARPLWRMLSLIAATGLYCALIGMVGFLIASVLFAFAIPVLLGRRDMILLTVVALAYCVVVWLLFEKVFLIILPASPWPIGI